jgi:processive 1,2-diacylglycerol beta-glucosyltransferase
VNEGRADVLILSSAIGSGHMRASAALSRGVELVDPSRSCRTVDFPREVSPTLERALRSAYLEALRLWPAAYGRLYRSSGGPRADTYQHYLGRPGLRTPERLVAETGAGAIVAPHLYGAGVLEGYKRRHPEAFCAAVITDYIPHPLGVPQNLDLYVVADEVAAAKVVALGVPEGRVHPTGIPIDPAFDEPMEPGAARREALGLAEDDDLPVVLVMGGGLGAGAMTRVVGRLIEASPAMHLVVLCGSNEEARLRLTNLAQRRCHPATFMGFTDRVRDLMAASHALVSKPGGLTCTEALASGLPQVLYHPVPGNEEENAAAMVRYGAGVLVESGREVLAETLKVLPSPTLRRRMVEAARAVHKPHSARRAAELVLGGLA